MGLRVLAPDPAALERGQGRHLVVGELEAEQVEVGALPLRVRGLFGIGTAPSCTCQRRIACAGVTPWASAMRTTVGAASSSPRPSGLQLSVTIASSACTSRSAACGKYGCISTWFNAGTTPVSSTSRRRWVSVKFETPIDRTRPFSRSRIIAFQLSTYLSRRGSGQWTR
ncbi:hypothetical protein GCM10023215_28040 [Pseudonocardia yuanmonensis]|uniref:Uncharacterized protein n=1 Tax=Pseudonocardia yuanmonensis TaxID=1095914 RepID=A0ABP8WIY8_9PSEU